MPKFNKFNGCIPENNTNQYPGKNYQNKRANKFAVICLPQIYRVEKIAHEGKKFENINYAEKKLVNREFLNVDFTNCDFTKSDLSNNDFTDCTFTDCNFALSILDGTKLNDIRFIGCKLMGIDFSKCDSFLFSASFKDCQLDYASFFKMKIKKTNFNGCSLKEVDYAEADLTLATFDNCDLINASFIRTNLEKADFRRARNYSLDPELNKIKKAKFSLAGVAGLLLKYNIDIEH